MANFDFEPLPLSGVVLVRSRKFDDERGFFMETYKEQAFRDGGIDSVFVQDNHSMSTARGTLRGLHFQTPPFAQAKLVRVQRGSIFDVAVDLRRQSQTFGKWCGAKLTARGGEQLFVPRGFAHGFCTLEEDTEVLYKVDDVYAPSHDAGLAWNDPILSIDWPMAGADIITSQKDARLPPFSTFQSPF